MKKSFKKAGAAVLSMAMLLSMGAMSMPVYAAPDSYGNDNATGAPGQVLVKITGLNPNAYHQGEGQKNDPKNNGDGPDSIASTKWLEDNSLTGTYTEKYDYLDLGSASNPASLKNIEEATVTMYRVAQLKNDKGWDWEDYIKSYTGNNTIPGFTSFAALLANKDGTTNEADKSGVTKDFEFKTSSDDLQNLASYLERVIAYYKKNQSAAIDAVKVGDGKLNAETVRDGGVLIPVVAPTELDKNEDGVISDAEAAKTEDIIGYYIIVTETDQAGVIVQPVLVSLHNGEKKVVSVKGSTIQFEKTMTAIVSGTETTTTTTGEGDDAVTTITPVTKGSDRFDSTAGNNLKNGLVAQNDTVKYEIRSQLPKYDSGVSQKDITPFVITDTASNGISINAPTLIGDGEAGTIIDPSKFKVYLANTAEGLNDASTRWELTGSTLPNVGDYQLEVGTTKDNHGFKLTITGYQMIEEDTRWNEADDTVSPKHAAGAKYTEADYTRTPAAPDKKVDQVQYIDTNNTGLDAQTLDYATRLDENKNKINAPSMQNLYISVQFEATVNKDLNSGDINGNESNLAFDRSYTDYIDITQVDKGMIAAVGETDLVVGEGVTEEEVTNAKKADIAKQVLRVQLFQGETRYNKTYATTDYASSNYTSMDATKLNALVNALQEAGYTEATAGLLQADDEDGKGEFYRILLLLAKDKENITRNGEYNTAHMTYGNKYATGGGDVTMNTNYSKVYSVNLKLSKFIETLELTAQPKIPTTVVGYATFWDQYKDKKVTIAYTDTSDGNNSIEKTFETTLATLTADLGDDGDKIAGLEALVGEAAYPTTTTALPETGATDAQKDQFGAASENSTLTANQKKLFAHMFAAENEARGEDGKYINDTNAEKPVEGAVFHLARISGNTDDATVVEDCGYAVSANDGRLIKLNIVKENGVNKQFASKADADNYVTDNTSNHSSDKSFVFQDGDKWYVGYVAVGKDNDDNTIYTGDETWDMLDIGVYEVRELQVPTGFKKWDKARFEIKADKDTAGKDLVANSWKGSYSADVLNLTAVQNASSSTGLASIAETQAGEAHFDYYDNGKNSTTGTLSKKMYNEYLDELPATGGMGTVLFTAGGIAVILMAGALFVVYMKKRNAEEEE